MELSVLRKDGRDSIVRFLNYPVRITYVGRLDKDSEGLLLMTNNGDIINRMMRAANKHEKEYKVTVDKPVTDEFLKEMAGGVPIPGYCHKTMPGRKAWKI